ncbi:MAG: thioredoxin domain-containing protein [Longimicrobiales bacterium]
MTRTRAPTNSLAFERSPFLQHGAGQPVDWWPWGEDAFRRAAELDRPILLDIGAVWCHWCHVMDAESYENEETARLINDHFVAIKVDRDERPDVDARYQRAVQLLSGQGGWPLTAFLDRNGEVFFGGTYFPPDERHGRPSFQRVLREVSRIWSEDRNRAVQAATGIGERLDAYIQAEAQPGTPLDSILSDTLEELAQSFDFRFGGVGRAPKFFNAGALDLLLDEYVDRGAAWTGRVVTETLNAMAKGGVYDQIGGGFHRYSTDARWIIPHFEKMAYDNGVLLETYARAAAGFEEPSWESVVDGILAHYADVSPGLLAAGGFPASQDADFGFDNDGDYWTWTEDELTTALGDQTRVQVARLRFGFGDPAGRMHVDTTRHVLFLAMDEDAIAGRTGIGVNEVGAHLREAVRTLKRVRDGRQRPFVDETQYAGWVALVVRGHLAAARWLLREHAQGAALRTLERLWQDGWVANRGVRHRTGDADAGYYLEDQAHVAQAFFDAWELTQEPMHLERCRAIVDTMIAQFRDATTGAFRDRPAGPAVVPALARAHTPIADSPTPSGNGSAALVLLRLHAVTREPAYAEIGHGILRAFAGTAGRMGSGAATWMKALAWAVRPITHVAVVDNAPAQSSELLRTALRSARPRVSVRHLSPGHADPATLPPELVAMIGAEAPRAYVCAGSTCAAPAESPDALEDTLRTFQA